MNNNLKICLIVGNLPPTKCGIADYTWKLLLSLKNYPNIKISVITGNNSYINKKTPDDLKIYPIIKKWNIFSFNKIKAIIKKNNPDIIHFQHPSKKYGKNLFQFILPAILKGYFKNKKIMTTIHEYSQSPWYAKPWIRLLVLFSDYLIFTSQNEKNALLVNKNNKPNKIIHIGSNIEKVNFEKNKLQEKKLELLKGYKFLLGYFGFVDSSKGLEELFNFMNNAKNKIFKLIIIGELNRNNNYHCKLLKYIENNNLENSIKITGYLSAREVSKILSVLNICVLPYKEGATLRRGSLLTALAHNLPVITKKGPENEIFRDKENMLLYNSEKDLREKIFQLYNNKKLISKIKGGTKKINGKFIWSKIADKTYKYYQEIMSK
ncbi:MAG: glycosyltransferase [Patescibacteria group bacterium]|nr:glycosyltransferase [Patescibacteria group bacterium]